MKLLNGADILAANDWAFVDVECPEWGGVVRVRRLTGVERDAFESDRIIVTAKGSKVDTVNTRAKLVALAACDADGKRIFTDDQVARLGNKSAAALDRCYDAAARLCGMTAADREEIEKN